MLQCFIPVILQQFVSPVIPFIMLFILFSCSSYEKYIFLYFNFFLLQIKAMAESKAVGVLVYALPGNPIQDMNCAGDECNTTLNIPASMLHFEPAVAQALS